MYYRLESVFLIKAQPNRLGFYKACTSLFFKSFSLSLYPYVKIFQ